MADFDNCAQGDKRPRIMHIGIGTNGGAVQRPPLRSGETISSAYGDHITPERLAQNGMLARFNAALRWSINEAHYAVSCDEGYYEDWGSPRSDDEIITIALEFFVRNTALPERKRVAMRGRPIVDS